LYLVSLKTLRELVRLGIVCLGWIDWVGRFSSVVP
jgi:hypothetical protein